MYHRISSFHQFHFDLCEGGEKGSVFPSHWLSRLSIKPISPVIGSRRQRLGSVIFGLGVKTCAHRADSRLSGRNDAQKGLKQVRLTAFVHVRRETFKCDRLAVVYFGVLQSFEVFWSELHCLLATNCTNLNLTDKTRQNPRKDVVKWTIPTPNLLKYVN